MQRHLMVVLALVALAGGGVPASAQDPAGGPSTGADLYREYCVGCHGRSGRGDGAVAGSLRSAPPDLGTLAERNNGVFPRQRVKGAILNVERPVAAHTTGDMPVWAHVFSAMTTDNAEIERRTDALVAFVETLQRPVVPTIELGQALFASHCAACHGPQGGGGDAPDLTRYALRNGGAFPANRLAQVIDGRGIPAHGSSSMPRWGDAFRVRPGETSQRAADARVEAVTRYLESLQRRAGD